MYATRAASRAAPAVFRAGIRTSIRPHRPLNRSSPAVSILIPLRFLQTESTSSSSQNYPPPGFDAKQASKPLPKQEQQQALKKEVTPLKENIIIPKSGPTAHAKTVAQDARTLKELAKDKADAETTAEKKALAKKEDEKKKLTIGQKIKKELLHYWDGTKLLVTEVRISSKLALKMAAGYELTRRERRQVRIVAISLWQRVLIWTIVATYSTGSRTTNPVLAFCHCSIRRIAVASGTEAVPQHASQHIRGPVIKRQEGHHSSSHSKRCQRLPPPNPEGDWLAHFRGECTEGGVLGFLPQGRSMHHHTQKFILIILGPNDWREALSRRHHQSM
jgi:hypothetical protein